MTHPVPARHRQAERRLAFAAGRCQESRAAPDVGGARLEFMLTVIVVGVLAAFALDRIGELQLFAQQAEAATVKAQERSAGVLAEAHAAVIRTSAASAASTPSRPPSTQAPLAGMVR